MEPRYPQLVEMLQKRLYSGDYPLDDLPGERKLAADLGVSHMTARRAIKQLIEEGVLAQKPTGRLQAGRKLLSATKGKLQIAFLMPAFESVSSQLWYYTLSKLVTSQNGELRPVPYVNFYDPSITATLDAHYDGIFLTASAVHEVPQALERRLKEEAHRLVSVIFDLTYLGIPSLETSLPEHVDKLIAHLASLGHTRIDCFNTQPLDSISEGRIDQWKKSIEARGLAGTMHNYPVKPYEFPDVAALSRARKWFEGGVPEATAVLAITTAAAVGIMRAAHEKQIKIGRDLSLCVCDGTAEMAQLYVPSLTTLDNQNRHIPLSQGLEWIVSGGRDWKHPLRLVPGDVNVWPGESTGPARRP